MLLDEKMKIIIILTGILVLSFILVAIILVNIESNYNNNYIIDENITHEYKIPLNLTRLDDFEEDCWETNMYFCRKYCNQTSGLYIDYNFNSFDKRQFDLNGDDIINGTEKKEMEYVLWITNNCMKKCKEEYVNDCFSY